MAEEATIESRFDILARLDENYLFLLQFADEAIKKLKEDQQKLAKKWLLKLGALTSNAADDKLNRNVYLNELILQMQDGRLKTPFNSSPTQEALPKENYEKDRASDQIEDPKWIDQLMKEQQGKINIGGKNFETYLSTKMFEDGRGACAYLAVSCQNEGDITAWLQIKSSKTQESKIEELFNKEIKEFIL